jgi:hypothetical protein
MFPSSSLVSHCLLFGHHELAMKFSVARYRLLTEGSSPANTRFRGFMATRNHFLTTVLCN